MRGEAWPLERFDLFAPPPVTAVAVAAPGPSPDAPWSATTTTAAAETEVLSVVAGVLPGTTMLALTAPPNGFDKCAGVSLAISSAFSATSER